MQHAPVTLVITVNEDQLKSDAKAFEVMLENIRNTSSDVLELKKCSFSKTQLAQILAAANQNPRITEWRFMDCFLDEHMKVIAVATTQNKMLRTLVFSGLDKRMMFRPTDVIEAVALLKNSHITAFVLEDCHLYLDALLSLAKEVAKHPTLKTLTLRLCEVRYWSTKSKDIDIEREIRQVGQALHPARLQQLCITDLSFVEVTVDGSEPLDQDDTQDVLLILAQEILKNRDLKIFDFQSSDPAEEEFFQKIQRAFQREAAEHLALRAQAQTKKQMQAFLMGQNPKAGKDSSVLKLSQNRLFDPQVLRLLSESLVMYNEANDANTDAETFQQGDVKHRHNDAKKKITLEDVQTCFKKINLNDNYENILKNIHAWIDLALLFQEQIPKPQPNSATGFWSALFQSADDRMPLVLRNRIETDLRAFQKVLTIRREKMAAMDIGARRDEIVKFTQLLASTVQEVQRLHLPGNPGTVMTEMSLLVTQLRKAYPPTLKKHGAGPAGS